MPLCDGCNEKKFAPLVDCGGTFYCPTCMEDNDWFFCDSCDHVGHSGHMYTSNSGIPYCNDCYNEYFICCDGCGEEVDIDNAIEIGSERFCNDCGPRNPEWDYGGFECSDTYTITGSKRNYGVEIETARCLNSEYFKGIDAWGCKEDSSISGMEFYSDILRGDDGLAAIDDLCKFARNNGWTVDDDCGLHIHLDMRKESEESLKAIAAAFNLTYDVWCKFVSSNRIRNCYCRPNDWSIEILREVNDFRRFAGDRQRYQWFNLYSYCIYETFEIRLHQGTLDTRTIKNWIRALLLFADWAATKTLDEITDYFDWPIKANTLKDRFNKICEIWADYPDLVGWFEQISGMKFEEVLV